MLQKERAEFFCNSEHTVSVRDVNKLKGHGGSSVNGIFNTTDRTETAVAAERNKFEHTTDRTTVHGTAKGGIAAMDHFINIFYNSLSWMKGI